MHIYYISGSNPDVGIGGGELANRELIRIGRQLGHTIDIYIDENSIPKIKPDLYWLCNIRDRYSDRFLYGIVENYMVPFILQDDAYQTLCPQPTREYRLCFDDQWDDIVLDKDKDVGMYDCRNICRYNTIMPLVNECAAFVGVSPMHVGIWSKIFPSLGKKTIIVDPQVRPDAFKPGDKIPNTYIYCGVIAKGKGFDRCVTYSRNRNGTMYTVGDIHHTINMNEYRDVTYLGSQPYNVIPNIMSKVQYLIHLPTWREPQGRTITEGLLSGCVVIGNRKVGALSYEWLSDYCRLDREYAKDVGEDIIICTLSDYDGYCEWVSGAPYRFWKDFDNAVGD